MSAKNQDNFKTVNKIKVPEEEKHLPQILCLLVVALGCLSIGIMWAWSSPFSLVLTQDKVNYDISEDEASLFLVFQPLGMIIFGAFYFRISEMLGTKKALWMLGVPHMTCWIIVVFAVSKWAFYASRFIAGIGDAVFFSAGPPYIGEITSPTVRGTWAFLPIFNVYLGATLITALGSYLDVVSTAYICMVPSILFLVLMYFLPESPYQLIKNNQPEEAKASLRKLRGLNDVEDEYLMMKVAVDRQFSEQSGFKELFTIKNNLRSLRAGVLLRAGQQFSGISVFTNYCQMIFYQAGGNFSPQVSSVIVLATSAVFNLICSAGIEKFGRRLTFTLSVFACGIVLVLMSLYFALNQYELVNLEGLEWFPLAGLVLFIIVFSPGVGIIPTLMLGELFTGNIKYKSLCILNGTFGVAYLIASVVFTAMNTYVGLYGPFLLYSLSCFVTGVLALKWVPETKGRTLEEIQQQLMK